MNKLELSDFGLSEQEIKEADENVAILEFVTAETEAGEGFYAYIAVEPSKYIKFKKAQEDGEVINLTKLGEIVAKGWGHEAPPEIKKEMSEKYGASENFESEIKIAMQDALESED